MTAHPSSLPAASHPASKASSTSKDTHLSVLANGTPTGSRSSSQIRAARVRHNASSVEHGSEKATASLIRRVLGPQTGVDQRSSPRPGETALPPLTSSNEVDLQLYALIAVVVKEFVQTWYSKITPDHGFVDEVVHIIAHCSRAMEQRLRQTNVAELLFDEIPALVEGHILAYRTAHGVRSASSHQRAALHKYHALNPHPALSPFPDAGQPETGEAQARNETAYRQLLVQGALAVLLPTEDLQNSCLRTLVADIIADLILGQGVCDRACQSWFLYETTIKIVDVIKSHVEPKAKGDEVEQQTRGRLEKFGLLSSKGESRPIYSSVNHQSRVWLSTLFWRVLQYGYLLVLFARFLVVGLYRARSSPPRSHTSKLASSSPVARSAVSPSTPLSSWSRPLSPPQPILDYRIFNLSSTLLDLSTRMPWFAGLISFGKHTALNGSGQVGATNGVVDNLLRDPKPARGFTDDFGACREVESHDMSPHSPSSNPVPEVLFAPSYRPTTDPLQHLPALISDCGGATLLSAWIEAKPSPTRFLYSILTTHITPWPSLLPTILLHVRLNLFPFNSRSHDSSPNSQDGRDTQRQGKLPLQSRRRAAKAILSLIPRPVATTYFAVTSNSNDNIVANPYDNKAAAPLSLRKEEEEQQEQQKEVEEDKKKEEEDEEEEETILDQIEEDILSPFGDGYLNRHLIYNILDLVVARLVPEMQNSGVAELLAERGVGTSSTSTGTGTGTGG